MESHHLVPHALQEISRSVPKQKEGITLETSLFVSIHTLQTQLFLLKGATATQKKVRAAHLFTRICLPNSDQPQV